ncbi:MAG: exodeoxyribonuclease III [Oscillospiraceae bacterium]|jgi:exodeoxyribonuclease-3|nr:exodeoxyribonuclease III [Oscillospiraceae bacterium]
MKLISWNVNGLRACLGKGFIEFAKREDADIYCVQETKMQPEQAEIPLEGYTQYWNSADKKGYSGVAVFTKTEPLSVAKGIGLDEHDHEGRVLTLEFEDFYLVNCYTPNSQDELRRLEYRMEWEEAFRAYLIGLDASKPLLLCGDLNVAHKEIDLKNPKTNRRNAGFTDEERGKLTELLASGFIDTWRYFNPDLAGVYSWWSYRSRARENNAGWRIDYFIASDRLKERLNQPKIYTEITGSDHCPVGISLS